MRKRGRKVGMQAEIMMVLHSFLGGVFVSVRLLPRRVGKDNSRVPDPQNDGFPFVNE